MDQDTMPADAKFQSAFSELVSKRGEGFLWLDVNTSGAWKHVLRFQAFKAPEVRDWAAALASQASSTVAFRLATEDNQAVAHCTYMAATQRYEWRSA